MLANSGPHILREVGRILTQSEENPGREDDIGARPKESGLRTPIPFQGAELTERDDIDEGDVYSVIGVTRQDDGLGAQSRRRHLGDNGIDYGADGEVGCDA